MRVRGIPYSTRPWAPAASVTTILRTSEGFCCSLWVFIDPSQRILSCVVPPDADFRQPELYTDSIRVIQVHSLARSHRPTLRTSLFGLLRHSGGEERIS